MRQGPRPSVLTDSDQMLPVVTNQPIGQTPSQKQRAKGPTFCPLHSKQHFADMLRVVTGALDSPVQSFPAVLCVTMGPRAKNKQLLPPEHRAKGTGREGLSSHRWKLSSEVCEEPQLSEPPMIAPPFSSHKRRSPLYHALP